LGSGCAPGWAPCAGRRMVVSPENRFFGGPPTGLGPTALLEVEVLATSGFTSVVFTGGPCS